MTKKNRSVRDYMKLPYTIILKHDEDDDVIARVKELEGCVADGQDEMDALANLNVVKELWISTALEAGSPVPLPEGEDELPSGKFLTRIPKTLHRQLSELADMEGVSLNQLITVVLAEAAGRRAAVLPVQSKHQPMVLSSIQASNEYAVAKKPNLVFPVICNSTISSDYGSAPTRFTSKSKSPMLTGSQLLYGGKAVGW